MTRLRNVFQRKEQAKSPEINLHEMELRKISLFYLYVEISPPKRKKKVKQNKFRDTENTLGDARGFGELVTWVTWIQKYKLLGTK